MPQWIAALAGGFSGRAAVVLVGLVAGQGLAVLLLPVITRLYAPDAMGRAATTLASLSPFGIIVALQYDQALVVAEKGDVAYVLCLGSLISVLWAVFLMGAISLCQRVGPLVLIRLLADWEIDWLLPVLVFLYGHFLLLTNYQFRMNALIRVGIARFVYYGLGTMLQVVAGWTFGATGRTFLFSQAGASLMAVLVLLPYGRICVWAKYIVDGAGVLGELRRVAVEYLPFPKYQVPGNLLNAISVYAPALATRMFFSEKWAGWYYLSWRILAAPITLLLQSVGQVLYRDSAQRERRGMGQAALVERVVLGMFRISFLPAITLGLAAPVLVQHVMGSAWSPVAYIIRILLISTVVSAFTSPISNLLNVRGRQAGDMAFKSLLFAVRMLSIVVGTYAKSVWILLWLYSVSTLVVLLGYFWYIIRSVQGDVKAMWSAARDTVWYGAFMLAVGLALAVLDTLYRPVGLAVLGGVALYGVWFHMLPATWRTRVSAYIRGSVGSL